MLELENNSVEQHDTTEEHQAQTLKTLSSLVYGQEYSSQAELRTVYHAITGEAIYQVSSHGINTKAVVDYAKKQGAAIATWTDRKSVV